MKAAAGQRERTGGNNQYGREKTGNEPKRGQTRKQLKIRPLVKTEKINKYKENIKPITKRKNENI